jgi:hypothetical protein
MKRLAAISLSIILISLASWGAITAATNKNIPHEDPSTAETCFDIALPSLLHYSDILNQVVKKNYPEARALIQQLKLDYAHLPDEIRFIMARYNDLITELTQKLDSLDAVLDECEVLLSQNKLEDARPKLGQAKWLIDEAAGIVEDTSKATDELIHRLAPFIPPQEVRAVNEAKARLYKAVERLKELEDWYRDKLQSFETTTAEKEELLSTEVTLDVNPAEVWVGGALTASGVLKTEGNTPLNARNISILLDGKRSITATTAEGGSYEVTLDIPYHYTPEMIAQASYVPKGEDKDSFLASSSPVKKIAVLFHPSQLEVEAPEKAYPGLPMEISGKVSSEGNIVSRRVTALLDRETLFEAVTDEQGLFKRRVTLSPRAWVGAHKLSVRVAPEDKSRSAGCSIDRTLGVIKAMPQIEVHAPTIVVLPRPIEVSGEIYSDLPMQGAVASLETEGATTKVAVENGRFQACLDLPFQFSLAGFQEFRLSIKPIEPWQLPAGTGMRIFVINAPILGIILAIAIPLGVVSIRKRRRPEKEGEISPIPPEVRSFAEDTPLLHKPETKLEGTTGTILQAYFRTVKGVEKMTRIFMKPQMTLREFLKEVTPKLSSATEAFAELTNLAERVLYSPYTPEKDEALRAEQLASQVRRTWLIMSPWS